MSRLWKLLSNYKAILQLAQDVKDALADKQVTADEAKAVTNELIDLLVKLDLVK